MVNQHPVDEAGLSFLLALSGADHLNEWMFSAIKPWIKGKTLEIGSGIGNLSALCLRAGIPLSVSDYSEGYVARLHKTFDREPLVKGIYQVDLAEPEFERIYAHLLGKFDTIFSLNVIEHIADDHQAIRNCRRLLAPGGRLLILMPAYQALYNRYDEELGHYRRYTRRSMAALLKDSGFRVLKTRYFNLVGIFGWWWFGSVAKRERFPEGPMKAFNRLVPLFKLTDSIIGNSVGLSVIGVGERD